MVLISLIVAALSFAGGDTEPRRVDAPFDRYPAAHRFSGAHAPLRVRDARSRRLRSALEEAYDGEVDFAGRYVLAEIGCGAGCIEVAALDARTGGVHWLPPTVSAWSKDRPDPLEHRLDSRLLVVHGRLGEHGGDGPHAFVFDGRRFLPR